MKVLRRKKGLFRVQEENHFLEAGSLIRLPDCVASFKQRHIFHLSHSASLAQFTVEEVVDTIAQSTVLFDGKLVSKGLRSRVMFLYFGTSQDPSDRSHGPTQHTLGVHVRRSLNSLWQFRHCHLESALNLLQHLGILIAANKHNSQTLGTEPTSPTNSVQVTVSISRSVVRNRNVDTLDIDTTTKDVGGNKNTLFEVLKLLVALDTFFLTKTTVDADGGEVAFAKELVEFVSAGDGLDKDDDLVELERVEEVVEFAVLGGFFETNVVLLKTVEGELGLVVDVDFERLHNAT